MTYLQSLRVVVKAVGWKSPTRLARGAAPVRSGSQLHLVVFAQTVPARKRGLVFLSRFPGLAGVQVVGAVLMEGLAPVVASFASLAVAWFLVALDMRKA